MFLLKKHKKQFPHTELEGGLRVLLHSIGWCGTERLIKEALPHFSKLTTVYQFNEVMKNLLFSVKQHKENFSKIDSRILPCLYVGSQKQIYVLTELNGSQLKIYDCIKNQHDIFDLNDAKWINLKGTLYAYKSEDADEKTTATKPGWMRSVFLENRLLIYNALFLSFFLGLFALATPLFIMFIYNHVIGAQSPGMLAQFSIGIVLVLIGVWILQMIRGKQLAIVGSRLERQVGDTIFQRLLTLPPVYTESASVGAQVSRLKDFDRLRDFVTGRFFTTLFDSPFLIIALIIITILGGWLVMIPIVMIAIFVILSACLHNESQRCILDAGKRGAILQEFLIESVTDIRTIKFLAAENRWQQRYRKYSAGASYSSMRTMILVAIDNAVADFLMTTSGLATLAFGAIKIINGTLTVGAMLAIMLLIWRVLAPIKSFFNIYPRIQQMSRSLKQIDRLMQIEPETGVTDLVKFKSRRFQGKITFNRVSMRYVNTHDPALINISFEANPGEWLAIVGRNGCGKSTILKLILGLYQAQGGSVRLDNQDIRQFNPIELRSGMAYLPQMPELFYGTIAANMRLSAPTASEEDLHLAAEKAGILQDILAMPDGFSTYLHDYSTQKLASSFQQGICLARVFLKQSKIVLLDEPANMLDHQADLHLLEYLKKLHGKATILMVTHRPSHLKWVDKILVLDAGQCIMQGKPDEVLPKLAMEML